MCNVFSLWRERHHRPDRLDLMLDVILSPQEFLVPDSGSEAKRRRSTVEPNSEVIFLY